MENQINMTKNKLIIIGAIIIFLLTITSVFAYVNPLKVVETFYPEIYWDSGGTLTKVYDENNGATCYIFRVSNGGGISCIK